MGIKTIDMESQAIAGYVLPTVTPTPTVTVMNENTEKAKGWKVYRNSALNFSIKYPPNISFVNRSSTWVIFANKKAIENNENIFVIPHLQIIGRGYRKPEEALKSEFGHDSVPIRLNNGYGAKLILYPNYPVFYFDIFVTDDKSIGPVIRASMGNDGAVPRKVDFEPYFEMLNTLIFDR